MMPTANPPSPSVPARSVLRPGVWSLPPLLGCVLLLLAATDSNASPITFAYGGTITTADPSTGVAPGSRFSGTFRFDPEARTPSIQGGNFQQFMFGEYPDNAWFSPDTSGFSLKIGDQDVISQEGKLVASVFRPYFPPYPGDGTNFYVSAGTLYGVRDPARPQASLIFKNLDRWVFNSPYALPAVIDLADFPTANLSVSDIQAGEGRALYEGKLDTLAVVSTPEPAGIALLGLGIAVQLIRTRRRARRSA